MESISGAAAEADSGAVHLEGNEPGEPDDPEQHQGVVRRQQDNHRHLQRLSKGVAVPI